MARRAYRAQATLTRATGTDEFTLDLRLVMKGFDFDRVWAERRIFHIEGVEVPTARLLYIVESKHRRRTRQGQVFLATHKDALEQLLKKPE